MKHYQLLMKWHYDYDKEGTWFDTDDGENRYELEADTAHPFPHIGRKSLEIRAVEMDGDDVQVEVYADSHIVHVRSHAEPVVTFVHHDYSVCGDSVSESLRLTLSLEATED